MGTFLDARLGQVDRNSRADSDDDYIARPLMIHMTLCSSMTNDFMAAYEDDHMTNGRMADS